MASLRKIEKMVQQAEKLNLPTTPDWIWGYRKRNQHLSGTLREAEENWNLPDELSELLDEAAESLDDAHEEWLSNLLTIHCPECGSPEPREIHAASCPFAQQEE